MIRRLLPDVALAALALFLLLGSSIWLPWAFQIAAWLK